MSSVSVVGYRDLGKNVAQSLTYVAEGLNKRGRLHKVYPRGVIETSLDPERVETPLPFGRYGPSFLWLLSNSVYDFDYRSYSMRLVDYAANRKLASDQSDIAYFDIPGFLQSVKGASKTGKKVIIRGSTELANSAHRRIEGEYDRLGIGYSIPKTRRQIAQRRQKSLEAADQLIALSTFVRESYIDAGISPEKISVIPNAININSFEAKSDYAYERFRVLFVGSINVRKGVHTLIDAWKLFDDEDAELVLCGSINEDLQPMIDTIGDSNVRLPGWVDPEPHYREASVFVLPSLSEGFAKVILEAMSTGTPVIVSENSGGGDIIEDGNQGFVIPIRDPNAIADKLTYFRDHPEEIERMGRNARATAEKYDGDWFVDQILRLTE